jgi:hypothetical protein
MIDMKRIPIIGRSFLLTERQALERTDIKFNNLNNLE